MPGGIAEGRYDQLDLEKSLEGLVKPVMTNYRFREMSGGFGDTTVMTS